MSDVSKTNKLTGELLELAINAYVQELAPATEFRLDVIKNWNEHVKGMRAALAARVPVQGEPNDDIYLVTIKQAKNPMHDPRNKITAPCSISPECTDSTGEHHTLVAYTEAEVEQVREIYGHITRVESIALSRATVPDAATELAQAKSDLKTVAEVSRATFDALKAERDAALAAVERMRAIHVRSDTWRKRCEACDEFYPCPTVAALDGAPEPECEYRVEYRVPGGKTHVSGPMDSLEEAQGFVLENIHGGAIVRRTKEVSAGPWFPVGGGNRP